MPQRYNFFLKIQNIFVKNNNFSADLVEFNKNRADKPNSVGSLITSRSEVSRNDCRWRHWAFNPPLYLQTREVCRLFLRQR